MRSTLSAPRRLAGQFRVLTCPSRREFSKSLIQRTSWSPQPAPPRLPKEEQEIFEQLQQQSTGAFSTPRDPNPIGAATDSDTAAQSQDLAASTSTATELSEGTEQSISQQRRTPPKINQSPHSSQQPAAPEDVPHPNVHTGDGEELHPNIRRGARPEFEGEVNPRTGEKYGPKNEPLRWGGESDWSYNGRVTDF